MLFLLEYQGKANSTEDSQKRSLQVYAKWKPPAGMEMVQQYACADGRGFAIVEANSAAPLIEGMAPYEIWFDFKLTPILKIGDALPLVQKAIAWRDSVR